MPDAPQTPRIIIADDEPAIRTLLARQLQQAGYDVTPCAEGQAALDAMRELGSGILIADWNMPGLDGLDLCRAIRAQCEMRALGLVYYILLSGYGDKARIVEGFEAGADDYLTKPYHPQELLARIRAGERILALQNELIQGRLEVNKVNARVSALNARLEKLASTDALTGLSNRRALFERAGDALALAERNGANVGCIMLDVDRFKHVNDTHGHHVGDLVLQHVARTLQQALRRYDICGRVGGEEFVVICPSTPLEGTVSLAERLRIAIESQGIAVEGAGSLRITVSAGATTRSESDAGPDSMITRADQLLYSAKQNGRNQVWFAGAAGPGRRLCVTGEAPVSA